MVLSLSITGILAIIVVVLALIVVLLGMTGRVKKLSGELKVVEEDNITPYLRTVVHYKNSDFTDESKLNALNKISKQFFRDFLHFNSEKTFDDIATLTTDSDIKDFCSVMGITRYSKVISKSNIDGLYRSFENILIKRRPASVSVLTEKPADKSVMTLGDLNSRKVKRDIVDIKNELEKMKSQPPIGQESLSENQKPLSPISEPAKNFPVVTKSSGDSLTKFSVSDRMTQIEYEIDKESTHQSHEDNSAALPNDARASSSTPATHSYHFAKGDPTKAVRGLVKGSPVESMIPKRPKFNENVDSFSSYQSKNSRPVSRTIIAPPSRRVSFDNSRPENDDSLSSEITELNQRIQRLLDKETDRQLSQADNSY